MSIRPLFLLFLLLSLPATAQTPRYDQTKEGFLVFHPIKTDAAGHIIPWHSEDKGEAYDFAIRATWAFWDTMRHDMNGLPYYMNHQVWRPQQRPPRPGRRPTANGPLVVATALQLHGQRTGEGKHEVPRRLLPHAFPLPGRRRLADIPFPYNTLLYSGFYDGDMVIGKGYTQPDKAGSFGIELVKMYQLTGKRNYLDAAVAIANTLAKHTKPGDADNSPLPFKVNAFTGEVGRLESNEGDGSHAGLSSYTTNWSGTLQLFGN
jgi:hypothetical protein